MSTGESKQSDIDEPICTSRPLKY